MTKLAHPKVAQPKSWALQPQVYRCWAVLKPADVPHVMYCHYLQFHSDPEWEYLIASFNDFIDIIACRWHGFPWPSPASRPYRWLFSIGLPCYILYQYRVLASCPTFTRPCEGIHWSTSLMTTPLLFKQCPACLACLVGMVFEMGGRCPYSCCFVGLLYIDLRPGQTCHSKVIHRKEVTHSDGSYEKKSLGWKKCD